MLLTLEGVEVTSKLSADFLSLIQTVSCQIEIPLVREIVTPESSQHKDGDFGLVILDDESIGVFFVLLDDTLGRLKHQQETDTLSSCRPEMLCEGLLSDDLGVRALALGAVNAISQHVFRRAGLPLPQVGSVGGMTFGPGDHIGMVGLFPSLADRFAREAISFTVIEKRAELLDGSPQYDISLDPAELHGCNKVLITASTLLNDSFDEILTHCRNAREIVLVGPSAGCLPEPLFARGVSAVGGSCVVNAGVLPERLRCGEPWGDAVRKYVLHRDDYIGIETLLRIGSGTVFENTES